MELLRMRTNNPLPQVGVWVDDLSNCEMFGIKERHMKQDLKDHIIERLVELRTCESLVAAAESYARGQSSGVIERVDELLWLLVEVADDESQ